MFQWSTFALYRILHYTEHKSVSIVIIIAEKFVAICRNIKEASQMLGYLVKDSQLLDKVLRELFLAVPLTAVVLTEIFHCQVRLASQVQESLVCTLLILVKLSVCLDKVESLLIEALFRLLRLYFFL